MPDIFISYRQADSSAITGRIGDRLKGEFDEENVFRDEGSMSPGDILPDEIKDALATCRCFLPVIGPMWLNIQENGQRRLDKPDDWVRKEVETALRRHGDGENVFIIPVLVDNASMPKADELPESIRALADILAASVRTNRGFDSDVGELIQTLHSRLQTKPANVLTAPSLEGILPPPFEWCEIPAGYVELTDARDRGGTEGGHYSVDAFLMAKYPITNAQYQMFIDAPDGWSNRKWWDYSDYALNVVRQHIESPRPLLFRGDNLPRTEVTWYDAVAFCQWLSARTGRVITLSREQQWQRAAQGDDNRKFPWGNTFDSARANTSVSRHSGGFTPVDAYPNGASQFGVCDLCGNAVEWCLTRWGQDDVSIDGERNASVTRGSKFSESDILKVQITHRQWCIPVIATSLFCFRLCTSKLISDT